MKSRFLLAFLVGSIFAEEHDVFYFHTNLRCNLRNKPLYHYSIRFFEDDKITLPDRLGEWHHGGTLHPKGIPTAMTYKETEDGDEIDRYHFYTKIMHDCTDSGEATSVTIYYRNGVCLKGEGVCHIDVKEIMDNLEGTKNDDGIIHQVKKV